MDGFQLVVGVVAGALIAYAWTANRDEAGKLTLVIVGTAVVAVGAASVAEVAFLAERASRCPGRAEQGCALIAAAWLVARDASPAMVVGLGVGGGAYVAYWLSQRQSGAATVPPSEKPWQTGPRSEDRPVLTADEVHEALYGASRNQRLADRYGISLPEPDTDESDRRP